MIHWSHILTFQITCRRACTSLCIHFISCFPDRLNLRFISCLWSGASTHCSLDRLCLRHMFPRMLWFAQPGKMSGSLICWVIDWVRYSVQSNISTRDKRTDIVCLDNIIYVSCIDKQRKLVLLGAPWSQPLVHVLRRCPIAPWSKVKEEFCLDSWSTHEACKSANLSICGKCWPWDMRSCTVYQYVVSATCWSSASNMSHANLSNSGRILTMWHAQRHSMCSCMTTRWMHAVHASLIVSLLCIKHWYTAAAKRPYVGRFRPRPGPVASRCMQSLFQQQDAWHQRL